MKNKRTKTITVWQNGKQAKVKRLNYDESKTNPKQAKSTFIARIFNKKGRKPRLNKKGIHLREYKPIIIAFFSAAFIGLLLGFIMLNMMTNIKSPTPSTINADTNNQGTTSSNDTSSASSQVIINQMNAFVLQAGVFSDKSNALEWSTVFGEAGLQPIVWEREEQYFLFVGLTNTIEEATELLSELEQYEFDVFIKEWSTNAIKLDISAEEHAWLDSFQVTWTEALESTNKEAGFYVDDWRQLMGNPPFENERMLGLVEIMEPYLDEGSGEKLNEREAQMILLTMWERYENTFK